MSIFKAAKFFYMHKTLAALIFLFFVAKGFAQPFTLEENLNPVELKLKPYKPSAKEREPEKGRINVTKVTQAKDTLYYFVQSASIYSPVYVGLTSADPSVKIKVQLHKMNWKNASRSGVTDAKGQWSEKFKTENDFGIMVIPETKPAKYTLLVWVGDEAKLELPTVFGGDEQAGGKEEKTGSGKSGSGNTLLYVLIGLLAVAVGYLFIRLKNQKK